MAKKFKLGELTEDDLDNDYEPGRSESTMSSAHKKRLREMAREIRAEADEVEKGAEVVIVLEREP